ncbi:type VI secretion system-associated protein TagF [Sulfitobacter sp. F26204]|uniref:type VI secretion system-associated protein TagF n=1 Tax=Sulfitobacter sp. F26204 TaxID=2996014 RepID=UPI00225E6870|nr:type VI secretion system-associated protein TagF [Sulfitobacter sp. F26204]MCX7561324.1 type VI secretion system-associated protein TagF [Sulfitobacter sp. F26204]
MSGGFGAFGKTPALGDFFHINAPQGFVRVWDEWLQTTMMTAASAAGDEWDDQYMSSPIWRFTLAAGLAGPAKVHGVLMPSVDRVGRRFPLSLMATIAGDIPASFDHFTNDDTFEQLEDLALATLEDDMDRDRLATLLTEITPPPTLADAPLRRAGKTLVLSSTQQQGIAPSFATELINGVIAMPSLWSTLVDKDCYAMVCDGLPDAHQARALFDLNAPLWVEARPTS